MRNAYFIIIFKYWQLNVYVYYSLFFVQFQVICNTVLVFRRKGFYLWCGFQGKIKNLPRMLEESNFHISNDSIQSKYTLFLCYFWQNNLTAVGHYTQMVWAATHRVGCAINKCYLPSKAASNQNHSKGMTYYTYICNYCPMWECSKKYFLKIVL